MEEISANAMYVLQQVSKQAKIIGIFESEVWSILFTLERAGLLVQNGSPRKYIDGAIIALASITEKGKKVLAGGE